METGITTRKATRQYRLQQWQSIFHDRAESGLTVKGYCQSHGVTKDSYYYWLKVAREAAIEEVGPVFAELRPRLQATQKDSSRRLPYESGMRFWLQTARLRKNCCYEP